VSSGTQRVGDRLATVAPVGTYGVELVLKIDRRILLAFGRRLNACIQLGKWILSFNIYENWAGEGKCPTPGLSTGTEISDPE